MKVVAPGLDPRAWRAWSATRDGAIVVGAPEFDAVGAVALFDTKHGRVETRAGVALRRAERPLLWDPAKAHHIDVSTGLAFALPSSSEPDASESTTAISNSGSGTMARLVRAAGDATMSLTVWHQAEAPSWTIAVDPVPAGAGVSVSPKGDVVALLTVPVRNGPLILTLLDAKSGTARWRSESRLRIAGSDPLRELVAFSDDGAFVFVRGLGENTQQLVFERRNIASERVDREFAVGTPLADRNDTLLGITERHVRFGATNRSEANHPIGPLGGDRSREWWCELVEVSLETGRRSLDTSASDADYQRVFRSTAATDCGTHALLRVMGATLLVRPSSEELLLTPLPGPT
ncbi:MAG: hypothetical protein HS111_11445 [Kofleriaceae bacterium]|nr:hypothetical protein [Kofleriaceae bacterium]